MNKIKNKKKYSFIIYKNLLINLESNKEINRNFLKKC